MTPNQSTTTDNQPSACGRCLTRAALLAHLAPYIERTAAANVGDLLSLNDGDLAQAVAGQSAERITEAVAGMSSDIHRRNVEAAGCWSICRHYGGAWPDGLDELAQIGAIYGKGDCANLHDLLPSGCVSVVGARRAGSYGREVARQLGRDLAAAGIVVVSGLAFGVDACAHRGALETGTTVAVLGCGPDVAYPAAHRSLWRRVQENGLLLSELPPGTGAWRWTFPARNRIIAAMAGMTVVVEAAERSGSLGTARIAAGLGREVGAVPGPVNSRPSAGPNDLLADGAAVIRSAEDVLNIPLRRTPTETEAQRLEPVAEGLPDSSLDLRCPDCCSPEVALIDRGTHLECANCGAHFERDSAFVTVADAEAHADQRRACTCEAVRGCPQCFQRADDLVGALIRDSQGREWVVTEVDEKDGFPTICGTRHWDRPDEVTVLRAAGAAPR